MTALLRRTYPCKGFFQERAFTLTELLLGTVILGAAIAVSGVGLSAAISSSTAVNNSNERKDELNRALDFISAEIREADKINADVPPPAFLDKVDPTLTEVEPILWLEMGGGKKVVYYTAKPSPNSSLWRGPHVVYRWGPDYEATGNLKSTAESDYQSKVLIDSLHDDTQATWSCPQTPTAWEVYPKDSKKLGFYACVAPGNRVAHLMQVGRMSKVLGQTDSISNQRQVYSRSSPFVPPVNSPSPAQPSPPGGGNLFTLDPTPPGLTNTSDTEITLTPKGGAITCGANGVQVQTELYVEWQIPNQKTTREKIPADGITKRVPKDTIVNFSGVRIPTAGCNAGRFEVNTQDDMGTQIIALGNNEAIPFYQPFDNQASIDSYLEANLNPENRLSLLENQKVFLFEVGAQFSSNPGPAYDFQDIILLADTKPAPL